MSERIRGKPRSLQEMDFVAGTRACETCGDRSNLAWENIRSDTVWRTSASCPSCGTERVYVFSTDEDLAEVQPPELELGGGPSSVLDARTLIAEVARLGHIETTEFDWDRMERLQTAYNELAKLAPSPAVDAERARLTELVKARVAKTRGDEVDATPPRGSLDRVAQQAHWNWLQRGRTGEGRFDVVGIAAAHSKLDGLKAAGGRFERVDFHDSNFNLADWSETELLRCNFNASSINSTKLTGARVLGSTFEDCSGGTVHFERANIYGSSFARSKLDGALFTDATVAATSFEQVLFGNARWDRAKVQRCSFRGASLEPSRKVPPATMRGTVFEQCEFRDVDFTGSDLRAVTFDRCYFDGAHGVPRFVAGLTVRGGTLDATALVAQLVRELTVGEVLARAGVIVAEDRAPDATALAVFELAGTRARLIGRTARAHRDALSARAIPIGTTYGTTGVVWVATADSLRVHTSEGMPLEVTRTELKMSGVPSPISDVKSVALLRDAERRGRRGVIVRTPDADPPRLVVVQEDDWVASEDPAYSDEQARREGEWARELAQDLATWVGVAYDDQASGR